MSNLERSQRWQRRKDARPAELLDAALAEFFEKGFAAARLEDIAARAGVSKGTVYLYFDSKEEMFEALVQAIPKANVEQMRAIAMDATVPPEDLLRRMLTFVGGFLRDERMAKFPRLIISDGGRFPKLAETYKREVISRGIGILSAVIERGIKEGAFRAVDPLQAVTGCRPGKRTLRLLDYGKLAATFIDTWNGRAVRVAVRGDARERIGEWAPEGVSDRHERQRQAYLRMPHAALFLQTAVPADVSQFDLPGPPRRRVVCARCREDVSDGRDVVTDGGTFCRPCAACEGQPVTRGDRP